MWDHGYHRQHSRTMDPVQTGHGPPSLYTQPNFSNTEAWAFPSQISYSKLGGLLSKFKAHFDRIRNCTVTAQQLSSSCSNTHQECPFERVGSHGNVTAGTPRPVCWTSMQQDGGLGLWLDWAAESKAGCLRHFESGWMKVRLMPHIILVLCPIPKARPTTEQQPHTWNDLMPCLPTWWADTEREYCATNFEFLCSYVFLEIPDVFCFLFFKLFWPLKIYILVRQYERGQKKMVLLLKVTYASFGWGNTALYGRKMKYLWTLLGQNKQSHNIVLDISGYFIFID